MTDEQIDLLTDDVAIISQAALDSLEKDSSWLSYLEAAGVDNWAGYEMAKEQQREDEGK